MTTYDLLKPGDVLLYKPVGIFGKLIALKTWHPIAHVELYLGKGISSASRDGQGVNFYPWRDTDIAAVMRPKAPFIFDATRAKLLTRLWVGTPYGWWDLLNFAGVSADSKGIVCSPWVTTVLRDNGLQVFNVDPPNLIAPFQFLDSELLERIV